MVRLKGVSGMMVSSSIKGFNSIVVRLKARREGSLHPDPSRFQFHSGSIKRACPFSSSPWSVRFQFHSGSIKRRQHGCEDRHPTPCFNSIVVRLKGGPFKSRITPAFWFQFHSGSIKSKTVNRLNETVSDVSIP